jgi:preprotein translocase subunit SecA
MGAQEFVGNLLKKIFGSRNERLVKKLAVVAEHINSEEEQIRGLSDEQLQAKSDELKEKFREGATETELMPEAFAVLREASRRAQNHRHFDCQLIGGQVLYDGNVAEMRTGEGKTIVCHLAAYLKFLQNKKVHIMTVNDYLVERDAEFAKPIFEMLGASVGYIQSQVDPGGYEGKRHHEYACDITYGSTNEFGFDYLRDNMKPIKSAQVQGRLDFAIIDEVDSILIDEARTPLIISGPARDDVSRYRWADNIARILVAKQKAATRDTQERIKSWGDNPPEQYAMNEKFEPAMQRFRIDPEMLTEDEAEALGHKILYVVQRERKNVSVTHDGIQVAQDEAKIGSFYVGANMERPHLIEQSVRAHVVYELDKEYVVQGGQIIIVDEFTGRLMHGRQWSDGLHQAIEAKEGVQIKQETQTLATVTIQNFCKLYESLAGMTGTAATEADEFMKIYKLDVIELPTNRPVNRTDHNDKVYRSTSAKYDAIVDEIWEMHRKGRPADPFLLADLFTKLKPILEKNGEDTTRLDEALRQFNAAKEGDLKVIQFMMETYDEVMGDLAMGRPILVGTTSVDNSEKLSKALEKRYGIEHEVLNAKNHAREADIVAKAGHRHVGPDGKERRGNVTIATNMAGRGTDIKLEEGVVYPKCKVPETGDRTGDTEGNGRSLTVLAQSLYPPGSTKCCINCLEYDAATNCAHCFKPKLDPRFPELGRQVCSITPPCGLHIIGTERHESRRIDNQLRGRAGRQGDPGSSRFFLSLEDDLLKLFMPDWMIKMMEKLGLTEGTSLEDKRLSKGIERAQRKVEERNFSTRKNLLEWDEPMDYQRKEFYRERQAIIEGLALRDLVLQTVRDSVEDAVNRFLHPDYDVECVVEWCRSKLDLVIEGSKLDATDIDTLIKDIRSQAKDEARQAITTTTGEYIDREVPASDWDVGGLLQWAQRAYDFKATQNQLKKMEPEEITEEILEAAEAHYDKIDLRGVEPYLDPKFPLQSCVEWVRNKFEIEIVSEDLDGQSRGDSVDLVMDKVLAIYAEREITYPVEICLDRCFAEQGTDSATAAEACTNWVNRKYNAGWKIEDVQGKPLAELHKRMVALNREWNETDRLEKEVAKAVAEKNGELNDWARKRFGPVFNPDTLESAEDKEAALCDMGRQLFRYELSQLEHYVLLKIYDQSWKDHLLEMDQLKHAIMQRPLGGDQTHPQSQYAIEGRELFDQMWIRIRDKVTDVIFKVRMGTSPSTQTSTSMPGRMQTMHAEASGAFASAQSDEQAAMQAQGAEQKVVETIRREQPKVGRNDPCPCGSGKKYKQCHGKTG